MRISDWSSDVCSSDLIACRVDAECLTRAGFPTTADEVRDRYVGIGAAGMFADLESRHARPLPPGFADLIHERLARAFELELRAIEGIAAVVDALACPVCVASRSGPERLSHSLTHAIGRSHY